MITAIKIDNVFSKEEGSRKIQKLKELTKNNFHNFNFTLCAAYGSFDIYCESFYFEEGTQEEREKELLEAFSFALMALV